MKGYPKYLNTKFDYEYVMKYFPKENSDNPKEAWEKDLQALIDDRVKYFDVRTLGEKETLVPKTSEKIIEELDPEGRKVRKLQELKIDPNSKMERLGIEAEDIETALKVDVVIETKT